MISDNSVSSEEFIINAPIELVWDVLVDFANYGLWNEFCPSCEGEPRLGSPLKMQVDLGMGLQEQVEYFSRIEPCTVLAWRMENRPGDPIHAVRTQYLKQLSPTRCSYSSVDEFSGEAVPAMMEVMARAVEDGFNRCGSGLKDYCEKRYLQVQVT
jgi:hypothetical protein